MKTSSSAAAAVPAQAPDSTAAFAPKPVVLPGAHVALADLETRHAAGLFEAGRHPETWRWMLTPEFKDVAAASAWIDDALAAQRAGTRVPFAIIRRSDGAVLGSTSLFDFKPAERALEIGHTWLAPSACRTGANTEAKFLLLRHCFETLGCVRVQLKTDALNEISQRAIERLGATREGVLRRFQMRADGRQRDTVFYSILAEEWPAICIRLGERLARH